MLLVCFSIDHGQVTSPVTAVVMVHSELNHRAPFVTYWVEHFLTRFNTKVVVSGGNV